MEVLGWISEPGIRTFQELLRVPSWTAEGVELPGAGMVKVWSNAPPW
jgi:hypothetical protein